MKPSARILIAGCGYVGSAAATQLLAQGHTVFGIRRNSHKVPEGVKRVELDLLAHDFLRVPPNLDAVVWAVAPEPSEEGYQAAYVDAPAALLDFLTRRGDAIARAVLVASTSVWHREDGGLVDEQTPPAPADYRGERIVAGEQVFQDSAFRSVSLRLGGIYGPERDRLIKLVRADRQPPEHAVYSNRIWREDAASAIVHALNLDDPAPAYAVVDNEPADLRDVYAWLYEQQGLEHPGPAPMWRGRGNKRVSNRLLRASGWEPSVPDFRVGFGKLLDAWRKRRSS